MTSKRHNITFPTSPPSGGWGVIRGIVLGLILLLLLAACSTTKNLPEEEVLYTGIKEIKVEDPQPTKAYDAAMEEVENALAYAPNNSLFGSSSIRTPLPIRLWTYNAFVNKQGTLGKWIFKQFAAKPVFINTVNPEVRAAVAGNILRENGYFNGTAFSDTITDRKNPRKAKVSYTLQMGHAYTYDSIRYMGMRHFADTLINASMHETLLHKGDQFNVVSLEAERQRIATLLRNNGFYYFRPNHLVYEADTLITPGKVYLRVNRVQGLPWNALRPYKIGNISVYMNGYENEPPTDSLEYKDMKIHYHGKLRVRPPVLYNRFSFQSGDLYKQTEQQRTQTGISRLNIFRFAEFQYLSQDTSRRSANNLLDLKVNTVYDMPYDGELEVNVTTKDNNYTGPGAIFSLTRRNAFKGGETFGMQLKGNHEWQTGNRTDGSSSKVNSYELGLSSTLTFPFILWPGYIYRDLDYPSSTTFRISADLLNRARYFKMYSFGGGMTYDFRSTPTTRHSFTPFRLHFNKLNPSDTFLIIAEQNKGLYMSLQNQFIPAISYTFTYDNNPISDRHTFWWQNSVTQSGNILGGIYAIAGKDFNKEGKMLLGNPFSQFIKGTSEIRYNRRIDRNNRLVGRAIAGAIYSYGNARFSPYSEQFYIGGANSVRAFTIRSIGPGRYLSADPNNPYAYIDRTGDVKFEANLEYRFKIAGSLNGAVFLDSGGIWLIRNDEDRPGGQLKMGKFLNDMATGTGAGLRYDMDIIVIRLDFGFALHLPYETGKSGYFNINPFSKGGWSWHFAVGYPF